jgi:hypothetical protein
MGSPFIIPLMAYAMVVLVVGIIEMVKLHELEVEVHRRLHVEELEHQQKMKQLNLELERVSRGG